MKEKLIVVAAVAIVLVVSFTAGFMIGRNSGVRYTFSPNSVNGGVTVYEARK